jgi:hypothetical protein
MYRDLGLQPDQIFLLKKGTRKSTRKNPSDCRVIEDGYQLHSQELLASKRPLELHNAHNSMLRNSNFVQQKPQMKGLETNV